MAFVCAKAVVSCWTSTLLECSVGAMLSFNVYMQKWACVISERVITDHSVIVYSEQHEHACLL